MNVALRWRTNQCLRPAVRSARLDAFGIEERAKGGIEFFQRGAVDRVVHPARVQCITFHIHQTHRAQFAQMVRNQVGRHIQGISQFAIALHAFHQQVEDEQAFGLG